MFQWSVSSVIFTPYTDSTMTDVQSGRLVAHADYLVFAEFSQRSAYRVCLGATSRSDVRETLKYIYCPRSAVLYSALVIDFRNLAALCVGAHRSDVGSCIFHLTGAENPATALPRLKLVVREHRMYKSEFGSDCPRNWDNIFLSCRNDVNTSQVSLHWGIFGTFWLGLLSTTNAMVLL